MNCQEIKRLAEENFDFAVQTRRRFHAHPELSNQEHETTQYIIDQLEQLGIPYIRPAETGVIAVIRGKQPGKVLGIRADIDALPIQERNDVPYRSQNDGVMHACGHDAHAAELLATAKILWELRSQFRGTVKLIFQPAEEYFPSGALAMMAGGDLDDCGAIIGTHILTNLPVGKICVEAGGKMAASASVNIRVKGKGGHGGMPYQAVDAIVAAAAIIMNLQPLVSRELNFNDPAVVTIGILEAGTGKNIIAEEAYMTGTLRYFNNDLIGQLETSIRRIAENTAAAYRAQAEVEIVPGLPAVVNDAELSRMSEAVAAELFGADALIRTERNAGCDDFAYYAQKAPILYAQIGAGNPEKIPLYPHHNPRFDLDEDCMKQAAEYFTGFALTFLNS
ncbi:amidohydrolase [Oscillibacter valericigenes]|uniref:Amidohydrolase n=1 Tax=Oscillibacter valericigenes TaxID=351091 RepID=A0ABS2FXU9_9FIRM|nr:amidohydrolase [Oscillibacter valericigenes]MBM6852489.1 amidohydrolase [Oscillibacter valericigenes]